MRVQQQLLRANGADRLAPVQMLDELGDEAIDELDTELGEILSGGGEIVPDQRYRLFHVLDEGRDIGGLIPNGVYGGPDHFGHGY